MAASCLQEKDAPSPSRVKPVSILVIVYILNLTHSADRKDDEQSISDIEYTGTTTEGAFFCMQDVSLYIGDRRLDTMSASYAELEAATYVAYTFTTQKNGKCGEKMIHSRSSNALCCPIYASIRRIKNIRLHGAKSTAPIASYYHGSRRIAMKARNVTNTLWSAMTATSTETVSRPMKSAPVVYDPEAPWRCFVSRLSSTLSESLGDGIAMS
jgi:hypothetical protein